MNISVGIVLVTRVTRTLVKMDLLGKHCGDFASFNSKLMPFLFSEIDSYLLKINIFLLLKTWNFVRQVELNLRSRGVGGSHLYCNVVVSVS